VTITAAMIALAGSLAALFSRYLRKDLDGKDGGILKRYTDLRDMTGKARTIATVTAISDADRKKRFKVVNEANDLAGKLHAALTDLGEHVKIPNR